MKKEYIAVDSNNKWLDRGRYFDPRRCLEEARGSVEYDKENPPEWIYVFEVKEVLKGSYVGG